jgi:hypothetical protein
MNIETGQVFVIDYHTKKDGSVERKYYFSDGTVWQDMPSTREFRVLGLTPAIRTDKIIVSGKEYDASYFGELDMTSWTKDYKYREFWRLENAYDDFKGKRTEGSVLPYNNYPMNIEIGQVFVIDRHRNDGTVERVYFRSDGDVWENMTSTREFWLE